MTFAEADAAAREIAAGLVAPGVVPGDRVCLLAQTRLEWVLCDVAILLAGGGHGADLRLEHGRAVRVHHPRRRRQAGHRRGRRAARTSCCRCATGCSRSTRLVHMSGDATLEKPDAQGRTRVTLAEVAQARAIRASLDELRAAGRAWLGPHPAELDSHAAAIAARVDVHHHLHLGHDRRPQGRGADAREPDSAGVCSAIRAMNMRGRRRAVPVPAAGPRAGARDRVGAGFEVGCMTAFSRGDRQDQGRTWSRCGRPSWPACRASSRSSTPACRRR